MSSKNLPVNSSSANYLQVFFNQEDFNSSNYLAISLILNKLFLIFVFNHKANLFQFDNFPTLLTFMSIIHRILESNYFIPK